MDFFECPVAASSGIGLVYCSGGGGGGGLKLNQ